MNAVNLTDQLAPKLDVFDELHQLDMFAIRHEDLDAINRALVDLAELLER